MSIPWHAHREEVFAMMRQVDEAIQHAWGRARDLAPRSESISVGSADFDHTLKATIGEQYLRVLRTGGNPSDAYVAAVAAGKESIGKWNATGCMSRAIATGRYELHRNECAAESIALGFHSRFTVFCERLPIQPIQPPAPEPQSRVRFQAPIIDGSRYCGPVCLSALTGIGTRQICAVLRSEFEMKSVRGTTLGQMKWFIEQAGYHVSSVPPRGMTIKELGRSSGVFLVNLPNHWMLVNRQQIVCSQCRGISDVTDSEYRDDRIVAAYEIHGEMSDSAFKALAEPRKTRTAARQQMALF